jgi:hypothetical protein
VSVPTRYVAEKTLIRTTAAARRTAANAGVATRVIYFEISKIKGMNHIYITYFASV